MDLKKQNGGWLIQAAVLLFVFSLLFAQADELDFIEQTQYPLTPEQKTQLVDAAIQQGNWTDLGNRLINGLVQTVHGNQTQDDSWRDRLFLARAFLQLGTPEKDLAQKYFEARSAVQSMKTLGDEANAPKADVLARRFAAETLRPLLLNTTLLDSFESNETDLDYPVGGWRVLNELQAHAPNAMSDYASLAVALALVYDQALPPAWPHHQVAESAVPLQWGNWNDLFDFFVQSDQHSGQLSIDLKKFGPDQLKFVIDAPLKIEELQWAQKNVRKSRTSFEEVFSMVKYNYPRYTGQIFNWPGVDYSLATILKTGGICVDQAYFAAMVGKAHGLPTLYFEGEGLDGGHAWFGFLKTDQKWDLDGGRYENQGYVTGVARDPQTWMEINDHELSAISVRLSASPEFQKSRDLVLLVSLATTLSPEMKEALLKEARDACPENLKAWQALAQYYREQNRPADLKQLYADMIEKFHNQQDVRVMVQNELASIAKTEGDAAGAEALQRQIVKSNTARRSDLGIDAGAELLQQKLEAKDYPGAFEDYKKIVRQFKDVGGGNLFYETVRPFVLALHQAGQDDLAKQALGFARQKMAPAPDGIIYLQFQRLEQVLKKKGTQGTE